MPSSRALPVIALAASLSAMGAARAAEGGGSSDGLWGRVMETFNLKAEPAGPAPDFVRRTRPKADRLEYIPTTLPHKVSPLAVKTAAQIQAEKDALDAAKARQLNPTNPQPLELAKAKRPAKAKPPAPAVAD